MKFRNTLILLAVLVALGAYVLLVEVKKPAPEAGITPSTTPIAPIISFDKADLRALRLSVPGKDRRTELVYESDKWHVRVPVQEEADQDEVGLIIGDLAELHPQRVLTESLGSLADYELDPPRILVEMELQDGSVRTLKIGAQDAIGSGYYAQVAGDERLYMIPYYVGSELERTLDQPPVKPTPTASPTQEATYVPLQPTTTPNP